MRAREEQLQLALEEIQRLGHSSHHGRGYTLATIAKRALANDSPTTPTDGHATLNARTT